MGYLGTNKKVYKMGLAFATKAKEWGFRGPHINNFDIETGEPMLPVFIESRHKSSEGTVNVFVLIESPTLHEAWEMIAGRLPVEQVYWSVAFDGDITGREFQERIEPFLDMDPGAIETTEI